MFTWKQAPAFMCTHMHTQHIPNTQNVRLILEPKLRKTGTDPAVAHGVNLLALVLCKWNNVVYYIKSAPLSFVRSLYFTIFAAYFCITVLVWLFIVIALA